jgi:prepilin-type N-terminal cleavage/methylation domain-containing protein
MKNRQHGFTIIELIIVIIILASASILFFVEKNTIQITARDQQRKVAINAMYYSLENVYYKQFSYYPQTISSSVLPSVDPNLFKDPEGVLIGNAKSDYRYLPTNCTDNQCKSYTLRANLENEADYVKQSAHS